ncbi:MAG: hypothetical protein WBE02_18975, partial [Bradyrhizobium sp.]
ILTVLNQVKIASHLHIDLISFNYLSYPAPDRMPDRRTAIDHRRITNKSTLETACGACRDDLGWPVG